MEEGKDKIDAAHRARSRLGESVSCLVNYWGIGF